MNSTNSSTNGNNNVNVPELATEKQIRYLQTLLWDTAAYFDCSNLNGISGWKRDQMIREAREWKHAITFVAFIRINRETLTKRVASALISALAFDKHPGRFMAALYGQPDVLEALGQVATEYWELQNQVVQALYKLYEEGVDVSELIADEDAEFIETMMQAYIDRIH